MADKYKQTIEFKAKTSQLDAQISKSKKGMASLSATALKVGASLSAIGFVGSKVVGAFMEQEKAERKLSVALGRSTKGLQDYAAQLQQVTTFGDETIMSAMAMIGAFVKDEEAIKKATKATLDLASAKGMGLVEAADLVSKTLGSSTNALSRYGIQVEGSVGSTERLESLTGNLANVFGGFAEGEVDTLAGSFAQLNNAWGDIMETVGGRLAPVLAGVADAMKGLMTTDLSEQIIEEKSQFESLIRVIKDSNTSTSTRTLAIEELKKSHGKYLSGLESEADILQNIDRINANYIKHTEDRITQQIFQEKIDKATIALKEIQFEQYEKEIRISKRQQEADDLRSGKNKQYNKEWRINKAREIETELKGERRQLARMKAEADRADANVKHEIESMERFKERFAVEIETNKILAEGKIESMKKVDEQVLTSSQILESTNEKQIESSSLVTKAIKDSDQQAAKSFDEKVIKQEQFVKQVARDSISLGASLSKGGKEAKSAAIEQIAAYATAAAVKQIEKVITTVPFPANVPIAAGAAMAVGAVVEMAKSKMMSAQTGASYIAGGGQMLQVGEAGAEEVNVTPLDDPTGGSTSAGGGSTIVFNNPILTESIIEDEIIPMIQKAVDRGAEFN